jgi:hypothetical protein
LAYLKWTSRSRSLRPWRLQSEMVRMGWALLLPALSLRYRVLVVIVWTALSFKSGILSLVPFRTPALLRCFPGACFIRAGFDSHGSCIFNLARPLAGRLLSDSQLQPVMILHPLNLRCFSCRSIRLRFFSGSLRGQQGSTTTFPLILI